MSAGSPKPRLCKQPPTNRAQARVHRDGVDRGPPRVATWRFPFRDVRRRLGLGSRDAWRTKPGASSTRYSLSLSIGCGTAPLNSSSGASGATLGPPNLRRQPQTPEKLSQNRHAAINRRLSSSSIRHGTPDDLDGVLDLWALSAAPPTVTDNIEALRSLVAQDPYALLMAGARGEVVGSLIAAWNGWRGSFYRLVVHPDHRRRGLATRLVREGEKRLRDRGAVRLDAIVAADEVAAMSFWSAVGYARQHDRSRFVRNF
jgi:ribosomal protein S18 acetylase RimI-like enzyme